MRVPLKNRVVSVYPENPMTTDYRDTFKVFEYAHENPLLGEIAGHVFNRYLRFRERESRFGKEFEFRFGSTNPNKAILNLRHVIDSKDIEKSKGRIEEAVYENAVEEILFKATEAIDAMHKLDNSFFDRLKFAFKKSHQN